MHVVQCTSCPAKYNGDTVNACPICRSRIIDRRPEMTARIHHRDIEYRKNYKERELVKKRMEKLETASIGWRSPIAL